VSGPLDAHRWARVRHLVESALDLPEAERERWLDGAEPDAGVRAEVVRLLEADRQVGSRLDVPPDLTPVPGEGAGSHGLGPGETLGTYVVDEELGRGGMGVVYRAWDTRLERWVALKVLSPGFPAGSEGRERLQREARAAARISHESVATVFALEEVGGQVFLVSELVAGETLRARLGGRPMPVGEAIDLVRRVAQGVGAAHALGVVHRDLKPENVLVTPSGRPKVVDFGIASVGDGGGLTRTGVVLGTPGYMSPEQVSGAPADARSDVFALGVLLYEMIGGRAPFGAAASWSVVSAVLERDPEPLGRLVAGVPPSLEQVVMTCLAKAPAARYPSAASLAAALDSVAAQLTPARQGALSAGPVVNAAAAGPAGTGRWWLRFHQLTASAVLALLMVPAWKLMSRLPRVPGRLLVMTLLVLAGGVGTARLHLWFTARQHDADLEAEAARVGPIIRWGNRAFAVLLGAGGAAVADHAPELAAVCVSCAAGTLVAGEIIEPATLGRALGERRDRPRRS
jgi:hypothetical protein